MMCIFSHMEVYLKLEIYFVKFGKEELERF